MGTGIERPKFLVTPLAEGLAWRGDGTHRFEEKIDGVTHCLEVTGRGYTARLWGEKLKIGNADTLTSEVFYAIDCLAYNGEDLRGWPRRESLKVLAEVVGTFNIQHSTFNIQRPATGSGGEFLEAVLAKGGEGVVASLLDEPFAAPRWKCKRVQTFIVTVTEKHAGGKSSVRVGELGEGNGAGLQGDHTRDLGWCSLFGAKYDQVRVGSVLKVEGYGLTANGKIREPRVCHDSPDSWLVRY